MSLQNRWEPRSSSQLQGQKMLSEKPCPTNTHSYTLFSFSFHGLFSPQIYFCDPHPTVCLSLDTNRLRGKISFLPEPLRKPRYEPSYVDIQFCYNFKKVHSAIPLEFPKDDQVLLFQGFNDVLQSKRDDGKRFSSTSENLKNGSPDQNSRCRTCAQGCYRPFKLDTYVENQVELQ